MDLFRDASILGLGVRRLLEVVVEGFGLGEVFWLSIGLDETCFDSNGKRDVILGRIASGFD